MPRLSQSRGRCKCQNPAHRGARACIFAHVRRLLLVVLVAMGAFAGDAQAQDRYSLAGGCYALKSAATGKFVAKGADGRYRASAGSAGAAEPFRMQATALGRYLLYGAQRDYMAAGSASPLPEPGLPLPVPGLPVASTAADGDPVKSAAAPSPAADWAVDGSGDAFTLALGDERLAVDGSGALVMRSGGGDRARFAFAGRGGCPEYPEIALGVRGAPSTGASSWGEVRGLVDGHMHMMAFEFLGGRIHCGRPWHPYGVASAMVDCPDHEPGGTGAAAENALSYGDPTHRHDTTGWPTFKDWPSYPSLTHEQSYYRWLERSWRAGQRVFVNLLVDNAVLCDLYPLKKNSCNEMDGVRLQARRIHELRGLHRRPERRPGQGLVPDRRHRPTRRGA